MPDSGEPIRKVARADRALLAQALADPGGGLFETAVADRDMERRMARTRSAGGLFLGIRVRCAVETDVAELFAEALAERLGLGVVPAEALGVALQEAVANAVMHGGLELGTLPRDTPEDFARVSRLMSERLSDPAYGDRPVELSATWTDRDLVVEVRDRGPGYRPHPRKADQPVKASGRGLIIIADNADAVSLSDGGRCLTMGFER